MIKTRVEHSQAQERHEKPCATARSVAHARGTAMHVVSTLGLVNLARPLLVIQRDMSRHRDSPFNQEMTMAESFKDKAKDAGHKIAEKATEVGHEVSEKAGQAKDWAKKEANQVGHKAEEAAEAAKKKIHEATK